MAEPHWVDKCRCLACQARSYLTYRWPGDAPTHTLKIATYGGSVSGSGEPDRAFDPAVREADFQRALSLVEDPFLRAVGYAARDVEPPKRVLEGDAVRFSIRRSDREVVRFLERRWSPHWYPLRVQREWENPGETSFETLSWLLDDCARSMSRIMGEEPLEGPLRQKRAEIEPEPVEFDAAPALRR